MNLLSIILNMSLDVQLILLILLLVSFYSVKTIVQLHLHLRTWELNIQNFLIRYHKQLEELPSDFEPADPVSATFKAVVAEYRKTSSMPYTAVVGRIERACHAVKLQWIAEVTQKLDQLSAIASCTLYVGLLGTIVGVMHCFMMLGEANAIAALAPGIAESLISTGLALVIVIIATVFWHLLNDRLDSISNNINYFVIILISDITKGVAGSTRGRE